MADLPGPKMRSDPGGERLRSGYSGPDCGITLTMAAFSAVLVPTRTGHTARMISRFKPNEWVVALSRDPAVSQGLQFSYGILPRSLEKEPEFWGSFIKESLKGHCPSPGLALLVAGPSELQPNAHHRLEFIPL